MGADDNVKRSMAQCVDCQMSQIGELALKEIMSGKRTRVRGQIRTDDWELPMLQKKFQRIISEHALSTNLQRVCQLEDRPLISRFFSKSSREIRAKEAGHSASPHTEKTTTHRVHTSERINSSHATTDRTNRNDLDAEDEGGGPAYDRQKTPMKKRAGKLPGSASLEHDYEDSTDSRMTERRQREEDQTHQRQTECT